MSLLCAFVPLVLANATPSPAETGGTPTLAIPRIEARGSTSAEDAALAGFDEISGGDFVHACPTYPRTLRL